MSDRPPSRPARRILGGIGLVALGIVGGFFTTLHGFPPTALLMDINDSFRSVWQDSQRPWYISAPTGATEPVETADRAALAPGLVLVAGIDGARRNFVRVVDRDGAVVQQWLPDWFAIWGDERTGFVSTRVPNRAPGAILHGTEVLPDGDLMVNFEHLSTVRLSPCGDVRWKLKNHGHHFIHAAPDGTFWVGSEREVTTGATGYANVYPRFDSWAIQQIAADGTILRSIEVMDILRLNGLTGLMYMASTDNDWTAVSGDTLHLNDVDVFPAGQSSVVFAPGDLMISLRNISTILVVDPQTLEVKFQSTGKVLRQHDPDFGPDDTIWVYDNNNIDPETAFPELRESRIVVIDAVSGEARVAIAGKDSGRFYSQTMGKMQMLDNGNAMIASSREGRAIELSAEGRLLWELRNLTGDGYAGLLTEAHVLPQSMDKSFFERASKGCVNESKTSN